MNGHEYDDRGDRHQFLVEAGHAVVDADVDADTLDTVYFAVCACGYEGDCHDSRQLAGYDAGEHDTHCRLRFREDDE